MSKMKSLVAVAVAAGLLLTGVAPSHAAGKTLTLGSVSEPTSFAAAQGEYGNRAWFYQAVYDTLMHRNADGTVTPNVATKWSYNQTNTVLTLQLKSGIKFTDGTALDAKAVVANINANRDSKGPGATLLSSVSKATAQGASTVILSLNAPDPSLTESLSGTAGLLESPKAIGTAAEKTTPVGSGPYILDKTKTQIGSVYTFKQNPGYWNKKGWTYSTLVIKYIKDSTAMVNALQTGAVQGANVATNSAVPTLKAAGLNTVSSYLDGLGIYFADRNGKTVPALKDVRVRQAIEMAFDREAMLKTIDAGYGMATTQMFPKGSAGYVASLDNAYPYDLAKAKSLMAAAGYANGFSMSMPTLSFYFGTAAYAVIKAQLAAINITVKEEPQTGATFIGDLLASKWPAYLMQFERSANAWTLINFIIAPNSIFNSDHYTDATSAGLIAKIQSGGNTPAGVKAQQALNTYLVDNAWFVPFYAKQANFAFKGINVASAQAGNVIPFLWNIH